MAEWTSAPLVLPSNIVELLRELNRSCTLSQTETGAVQLSGQRIVLPWDVVRTLLLVQDARPRALLAELAQYGRLLLDDSGLTIIDRLP
jgi:hypothetical protein